MKLKRIARGRAVQAKDEACGQTPAQEEQLQDLGWTEHDIDNMSAKQIEIILRKKTKRRKGSKIEAADQTVQMLQDKLKGAQDLRDKLKGVDYGAYNIGDFYKKEFPKSRELSDRTMKRKKDLEVTLYSFIQQLQKDLKNAQQGRGAAARMEAFFRSEGITGKVEGAHHQEGKDWYVDTAFINASQDVYPGAKLRHMGMGEFVLETPDGDIEFDRMRGKDFPGQSGRSHKLYGAPKAVEKLLKLMEQKGKSKKAEVKGATQFSPYGSKKGTWWGRRANDSKTVRLKDTVAQQWIKKPAMKPAEAPRNADEYLIVWWVPPEYGNEAKFRVEKNWIEPVWSWERGPNPKVKPGVDVVKEQK